VSPRQGAYPGARIGTTGPAGKLGSASLRSAARHRSTTVDVPDVDVARLGSHTAIEDRVEHDMAMASHAAAVGPRGLAGGTVRATFWHVASEVDVHGRCDQPVRVWDAAVSGRWNFVVSSIDVGGQARHNNPVVAMVRPGGGSEALGFGGQVPPEPTGVVLLHCK